MPRILGLDIDQNIVRGTWMRTALRKAEVLSYVEAFVGQAATEEEQHAELMAAVQSVLRSGESGRGPDAIFTQIDGRDASLRLVEIPSGAAKRADEVLPFELEPLIPFPIDDCVVDHQPVERSGAVLKMMAAALPKERVKEKLDELLALGVDPKEMAIGAASLGALTTLVPELSHGGPFLIADIRRDETDVCILNNGLCEFSRTLSDGLAAIEAGRAQALERGLKRTLAAYRVQEGRSPEIGFIAGLAATPEWIDWFTQTTQISMSPLPLPNAPGADEGSRIRFARATALAARSSYKGRLLNARQGELAQQRSASAVREQLRLLLACAAAILLAFAFSTFAQYRSLDSQRESLQGQLHDTTASLFGAGTSDPEAARRMIQGGDGSNDPLPRFGAFETLAYLNSQIPESMRHDIRRLSIEIGDEPGADGEILIRGIVDSNQAAADLQSRLQEHDCIHDVEDPRTSAGTDDRRNYELNAVVRCGAAPTKGRNKNQNKRGR